MDPQIDPNDAVGGGGLAARAGGGGLAAGWSGVGG
jgi:hypothetical protein